MDLDLKDEWYGCRLPGRHLVSDHGQRMTIERLRGLLRGAYARGFKELSHVQSRCFSLHSS